jgi:hypothetical protein
MVIMNIHRKYRHYSPFIIGVLSLIAALFYNELNVIALKREASDRLEPKYNWVKTADDVSYLRPAENYYLHGVWKDNNPGKQSYFLRTPGYGFFRYTLMEVFGMEQSYTYFKYVQVLIFSISVLLLFYIALLMGLPVRYALIMEGIYGLSPFASGFLYYSITEGISPALVIGYTFFLMMGYKKAYPSYFILAALILAYVGVTRPVLLLFGVALPLATYWSGMPFSFTKKMLFILLTGFIALMPIGIWALRSAKIAGEYVGIYPIYYIENNSQFRPTHEAIWEFQKAYGTEGIDFHQCMVPLWNATVSGDTADSHMDTMMMGCPDFVKETIGKQRLQNSYTLYRRSIVYQRSHYPRDTAMPDTVPAMEQQVIKDFNQYRAEINSAHWLWCHAAVPLKLFKRISFHSNLSLYIFQHTYRGRWWMEIMRFFFLILHFMCCWSFVAILLMPGDKIYKTLSGVIIAAYFFYLSYFFRGLEERYTLPILPVLLLNVGYIVYRLFRGCLKISSKEYYSVRTVV